MACIGMIHVTEIACRGAPSLPGSKEATAQSHPSGERDKGKPVERRGRKVARLKPAHIARAMPVGLPNVPRG